MFSTLHTNDAASAFTRLIDMGVEPFLVSQHGRRRDGPAAGADDLPGLQDDVRTEPTTAARLAAARLSRGVATSTRSGRHGADALWKGTGCRACRQTGYRGRTGIHELMVTNDAIRDLIVQRVERRRHPPRSAEGGMITLRQDGWRKVLNGTTTIDEVARDDGGRHQLVRLQCQRARSQTRFARCDLPIDCVAIRVQLESTDARLHLRSAGPHRARKPAAR